MRNRGIHGNRGGTTTSQTRCVWWAMNKVWGDGLDRWEMRSRHTRSTQNVVQGRINNGWIFERFTFDRWCACPCTCQGSSERVNRYWCSSSIRNYRGECWVGSLRLTLGTMGWYDARSGGGGRGRSAWRYRGGRTRTVIWGGSNIGRMLLLLVFKDGIVPETFALRFLAIFADRVLLIAL